MGKTYVLEDDLTGETLPKDTEPVRLSLGSEAYDLYLSDDSYAKLQEAFQPFTQNAEKVTPEAATQEPAPTQAADKSERVRLTGDDKKKFDQATKEHNEAKAEQRDKIFEYAATTDKHADAKDSGKNIAAGLVEDFYAKNPDAVRYYGTGKVEAPKNIDYKSKNS